MTIFFTYCYNQYKNPFTSHQIFTYSSLPESYIPYGLYHIFYAKMIYNTHTLPFTIYYSIFLKYNSEMLLTKGIIIKNPILIDSPQYIVKRNNLQIYKYLPKPMNILSIQTISMKDIIYRYKLVHKRYL